MTTAIKTKYVGGVFQPLETVALPEGFDVTVYLENVIPTIDNETRERLDVVAQDMADRIATLESALPEDEVANWHDAMNRASKPAHYIPRQGIAIESV